MRPFAIHPCRTVAEAVAALREHGDEAVAYAGGTELVLVLKQGLARYAHLVDVKTVPELSAVAVDDGRVRIGAAVTHRTLETDRRVRERLPLLAEVEHDVANVRVRNVGTLGGNLCFAEPHSDLALCCLLLDAEMSVEGPGGARRVPAADFVRGAYETCLQPGEILVSVGFPAMGERSAAGYQRFRIHERPTCAAGVVLTASADGRTCAEARVGVGAAGPVPRRVPSAEALLAGRPWDEVLASAREAGRHAAEAADPLPDLTGSVEYKAHLVEVFVERAAHQAAGRLRERGQAR
jgi:carbon-monoxide dehydrogenase medium subunit